VSIPTSIRLGVEHDHPFLASGPEYAIEVFEVPAK
jgi:hypothetical protein